jgi:hypothetical protein
MPAVLNDSGLADQKAHVPNTDQSILHPEIAELVNENLFREPNPRHRSIPIYTPSLPFEACNLAKETGKKMQKCRIPARCSNDANRINLHCFASS